MAIYELRQDRIARLSDTSFEEEALQERKHLQKVLRDAIHVISPDTMVLAEEFGNWEGSNRRIDLLGLYTNGDLVVIELKRTEDGGHMELQAIRYAAMVSAMTFSKAVDAHELYLRNLGAENPDAKKAILDFLGWDSVREEEFARDVRIVLASADFSKEITTAVMWLNKYLDIRCVRLIPYKLDNRVLLDVQQIIPLPEAEQYQVQLKEKATEVRSAKQRAEGPDFTRYDLICDGLEHKRQWKRRMMHIVAKVALKHGIRPEQLPIPTYKWLSVQGRYTDLGTFQEAVSEQHPDRTFKTTLWFTGADELFYVDDKTYALSTQLVGSSTLEAIDTIRASHPELGISYSESKVAEE